VKPGRCSGGAQVRETVEVNSGGADRVECEAAVERAAYSHKCRRQFQILALCFRELRNHQWSIGKRETAREKYAAGIVELAPTVAEGDDVRTRER
jgi:hypothetical protein